MPEFAENGYEVYISGNYEPVILEARVAGIHRIGLNVAGAPIIFVVKTLAVNPNTMYNNLRAVVLMNSPVCSGSG